MKIENKYLNFFDQVQKLYDILKGEKSEENIIQIYCENVHLSKIINYIYSNLLKDLFIQVNKMLNEINISKKEYQ